MGLLLYYFSVVTLKRQCDHCGKCRRSMLLRAACCVQTVKYSSKQKHKVYVCNIPRTKGRQELLESFRCGAMTRCSCELRIVNWDMNFGVGFYVTQLAGCMHSL